MKFSGLHFHMVLVIGLICIIVYIFYMSKDILSLDNEVMQLKQQIEIIQRRQGDVCGVQQKPALVSTRTEQPLVIRPQTKVEVPLVSDDVSDACSDVDSEQIRRVLNNMQEDEEEVVGPTEEINDQVVENTVEDIKSHSEKGYTLVELKNICREHGLSTKGTKEQLKERLGMNTV